MEKISHRTIKTNGINMHVAELGSGPVVLLIHGFPELWYSWRHQIDDLAAAGYHVLAPDLRGYGDTDAPPDSSDYSCFHIVGDLIGLLDELAVPKAFVVGHDWGSVMAYYFALFRPDRVTALVNISVPYTPRDPSAKSVDRLKSKFGEGYYIIRFQEPGKVEEELNNYDPLTIMKKFLLAVETNLFAAPSDKGIVEILKVPEPLPSWITEEDLQYFAKQFAKTGFTGGLNYYRALDLSWELTAPWTGAKLTVPTKFITGDKDLVYSTPGMKNYIHGGGLNSFVPNLDDIVVVEGAHHFLQQERPKEVSDHLLKFFGRISAL